MRRLSKVKIKWSAKFAYAIGLLATDGCLSGDGRHIDFTSKDLELVKLFKKCLRIKNKIGKKARAKGKIKKYYKVQFGDMNFYGFLGSIGLTAAKSKTIGILAIPEMHFSHFLRGCIDGDGGIGVFRHPESQYPQLRVRLVSASFPFLLWIKQKISKSTRLSGGWIENCKRAYRLAYAKEDGIILLRFMYDGAGKHRLTRKYIIAKPFLRM